jgi:hypothetical protein
MSEDTGQDAVTQKGVQQARAELELAKARSLQAKHDKDLARQAEAAVRDQIRGNLAKRAEVEAAQRELEAAQREIKATNADLSQALKEALDE